MSNNKNCLYSCRIVVLRLTKHKISNIFALAAPALRIPSQRCPFTILDSATPITDVFAVVDFRFVIFFFFLRCSLFIPRTLPSSCLFIGRLLLNTFCHIYLNAATFWHTHTKSNIFYPVWKRTRSKVNIFSELWNAVSCKHACEIDGLHWMHAKWMLHQPQSNVRDIAMAVMVQQSAVGSYKCVRTVHSLANAIRMSEMVASRDDDATETKYHFPIPKCFHTHTSAGRVKIIRIIVQCWSKSIWFE